MILIVGGLGAGKRDFARRELGGPGGGAVPGPGAWDTGALRPPGAGPPPRIWEELMGLRAVICNEVGCGLVPHPGGGTAAAGGGGPPLLPAGGEGRGGVPDLLRAGYKTKIEQTERNRHGIADDPPQLHQRESAAAVCRLPGPPPGPGGRGAGGAPPGEMPPIDGLWVSPMLRCRQTAEILFPGVEQRLVDALKECDSGTFEGQDLGRAEGQPHLSGVAGGGPPHRLSRRRGAGGAHRLPPGGGPCGGAGPCPGHVPARDSGPWRDPDVRYVRLCGATSGFLQLAAQQLRRIPSPGGGGEGAGLHPSGDAVSRLWVLLAAAALDWLLGTRLGCPTPYG